jgi:hypothetical protein
MIVTVTKASGVKPARQSLLVSSSMLPTAHEIRTLDVVLFVSFTLCVGAAMDRPLALSPWTAAAGKPAEMCRTLSTI